MIVRENPSQISRYSLGNESPIDKMSDPKMGELHFGLRNHPVDNLTRIQ